MRTQPILGSRRSRVTATLVASALALTAAAVPTLSAGAAAPEVEESCPEAFPVEELVDDQPVTGLTVSRGTTPEPFAGTVLGVLEDGIAPDLDMIMVRLTSPEIDRVEGIWAGMSGSPVYAEDGRLIGAVSYGLAFGPSPVAGVTPAADLQQLLTDPEALSLTSAARVAIPPVSKRELVASGDATAQQADSGLRRLPVPLNIPGLTGTRLRQVNKLVGLSGVRVHSAGGVAASASAADEIVPGGNIAASLAHGDFSAVGVGTATMVCAGEPVGFGHPFQWLGETTLTMHGARALYVQEDPTFFPFKVANPGAPVGTVDQDRMAGIKGVLGMLPDTATITTHVATAAGRSRTGATEVSLPDFTADAAAIGLLINQDRVFDHIGPGSALVTFTISGVTAEGTPFRVSRTNRHASRWDISYQTIFELGSYVQEIYDNDHTDLTFTGVEVDVTMSTAARSFRVGKVQYWLRGTGWVTLNRRSVVQARAGSTLKVRTTLTSYRDRFGTKTLTQSVTVPRARPGTRGRLEVLGAGGEYFEDEFEFPQEGGAGTASFADLLVELRRRPRNDVLSTTLLLFRSDRLLTRRARTNAGDVVEGSRAFRFRVVG